jgi:thioredoxin 1
MSPTTCTSNRSLLALLIASSFCSSAAAFTTKIVLRTTSKNVVSIGGLRLDAASAMMELNDSNYARLLSGDTPVLIDACAPWCGPCRLIEPVIHRCAEKWKSSLAVVKFNVEGQNPNLKLDMLLEGVMPRSLPSLILFHKSKAITVHNGVITDDQLEEFIRQNIPATTTTTKIPEAILKTTTNNPKKSGFVSLGFSQPDDYMLQQGMF